MILVEWSVILMYVHVSLSFGLTSEVIDDKQRNLK